MFLLLNAAERREDAARYIAAFVDTVSHDRGLVPIARYLAGNIPEDEVFAAFAVEDSAQQANGFCHAYYYIGTAHMLGAVGVTNEPDASAERAREYFGKCLSVGAKRSIKYRQAQWFLKQLEDGNWLP
jgi:hypothetical protein